MKTRPKVRYGARKCTFRVWTVDCVDAQSRSSVCECGSRHAAERIAAALNLHEAVRRGEIKVSK